MESFEVGKAPWEVDTSKSTPMESFEVGKAPWEVGNVPSDIPVAGKPEDTSNPSNMQVQSNYMNVPTIDTYTNDTYIGKNSSWLDDIISNGKDIVKELYNPVRPAVESTSLTLGAIGSGIGEAVEEPISQISQAIGGRPLTYYRDLNKRIDEARDTNDKEIVKSLGGGVLDSSTMAEIGLSFAYGNQLKNIVALEGIVQGAQAEPGEKMKTAAEASGATLVGGKVLEAAINRYAGTDRTLRKLYKTTGISEEEALQHFNNYSKVVGKEVKDFTIPDKVNAIVHGSPEAESVLFESVANNPANSKMLNEYYAKVSNKLVDNLDTMPYEQSIAFGKELKRSINEGYSNITKTLDNSGVNVVIDDSMKTAVDTFTKSVLTKLDDNAVTSYSQRVERLMSDTGNVGDLFEVEKLIRANINKVDKLGTDASLNEAKGVLKTNMQDLLVNTLKSNGLNNIVESISMLNDLYTKVSRANDKKLIKTLQNINIKKDDYKTIYNAMKSTEEGSSYDNLIKLVGENSKTAGNIEEFVLDRLMYKNMDDLDVINLGKLLGNLEDVNFKSTDGKVINQIITDFNSAFRNMKSTEAWAFDKIDAGGSKSDFINQIKASVIGRMAYKIAQYLPVDSSRRVYVINHLPKYLEQGLVPKNMKPTEVRSMEVYKNVVANSNRLLAEELNNIAEKSKAQAEYLKSVQPETPLLPNNQVPMTATERGSISPGVSEDARKSARANDVLGKPNTGQAVNSTTNELPSVKKPTEVVDTTVEPDVTINPNTSNSNMDIIDTEVMPSHTIDSNGEIWDSRGNKWGSVKDLIKAESIPDNLKLPEKVITPVKDFFDYKRILKEDPAAIKARKEVQNTTGEQKEKAKTRLSRLLEYSRLRDSGLEPKEAHKQSMNFNSPNIDNNGNVKLLLASLGITGVASQSKAEAEVKPEGFNDTRVNPKNFNSIKDYISAIEIKGKENSPNKYAIKNSNPKSSAYGKYQMTDDSRERALELMDKPINSKNLAYLKTSKGQEKAIDLLIGDYKRVLKLFSLPETKENIFVIHNLGNDAGARALRGTYKESDIYKMAMNLPDAKNQKERVKKYPNEVIHNYSVYYGIDLPELKGGYK